MPNLLKTDKMRLDPIFPAPCGGRIDAQRREKVVYMPSRAMSKNGTEKTKKDFRKNVLLMLLICNSLVLYITRIGLKSN